MAAGRKHKFRKEWHVNKNKSTKLSVQKVVVSYYTDNEETNCAELTDSFIGRIIDHPQGCYSLYHNAEKRAKLEADLPVSLASFTSKEKQDFGSEDTESDTCSVNTRDLARG